MILSRHHSVGPSFRQRGDLHDMSVQFDPEGQGHLGGLLLRVSLGSKTVEVS